MTIDHGVLSLVSGRYGTLQEQYNEAFASIQSQKQLITQLEEDLRSVNAWSDVFRGRAEVSTGWSKNAVSLISKRSVLVVLINRSYMRMTRAFRMTACYAIFSADF